MKKTCGTSLIVLWFEEKIRISVSGPHHFYCFSFLRIPIFLASLFFGLTLIFLTSGNAIALTSFGSTYRYKLEMSKDDKVCRHMEKVYKRYFRTPWTSPPDDWNDDRKKNTSTRLPGVEFNADLMGLMDRALFPSSPEFEAIKWREGRYKYQTTNTKSGGEVVSTATIINPLLAADFDIDNDGKIETVIQDGFFEGMVYGADSFSVYPVGTVDMKDLVGDSTMKPRGVHGIRLIHGVENIPTIKWHSLRPFILNGVTYLSGARFETPYDDFEPNHIYKDYMDILKYIKGSRFMKGSNQPPLEFETICRFRMTEVHQPSKGE